MCRQNTAVPIKFRVNTYQSDIGKHPEFILMSMSHSRLAWLIRHKDGIKISCCCHFIKVNVCFRKQTSIIRDPSSEALLLIFSAKSVRAAKTLETEKKPTSAKIGRWVANSTHYSGT